VTIPKNTPLKASDFLRTVVSANGSMLYHSLFSRPVMVSNRIHNAVSSLIHRSQTAENILASQALSESELQTLVDRYLVMNRSVNERQMLADRVAEYSQTLQAGSTLRRLDLGVSEVCNFGCTHCIHNISVQSSGSARAGLMTRDIAMRAIDKYMAIVRASGLAESEIHFGTTEPLINWKLMSECIDYCEQTYPGISHRFFVETNLSLLTREMADKLRDHEVRIVISIDGHREANDAVRVTARGEGTFDLIEAKCLMLREVGYPLDGFTITLTSGNFHLVDATIIEWAAGMGMTRVDSDIDLLGDVNFSVEDGIEKLMMLHRECIRRGIRTTGTWKMPYDNLISRDPLRDQVLPSLCRSTGGQNIAVAPNGDLFVCGHSSTPVGNINRLETFFEPNAPFLQLIMSRLSGQDEMCFGCEIEGQCAGQCQVTREVAAARNDNGKPQYMCRLFRGLTRLLLLEKIEDEFRTGPGTEIVVPSPED